jgi:hypothetical protein
MNKTIGERGGREMEGYINAEKSERLEREANLGVFPCVEAVSG